ncbi:MAG: endonuclease III domain-containing protein [Planctomycetota bacterium]|jgi:N-glycosylase/DNA lyase
MQPPKDFDLRATIRSHGWSDLPPFETDQHATHLVIRTPEGRITARDGRISARTKRLKDVGASCLRFDLDLAPFWALCAHDPDLAWVPKAKAGRFLRAPTAFADAVMILATTNCTWALTKKMLRELVEKHGKDGGFPTRERLARVHKFGFGYRDPYLAALARGPDLEKYRSDDRPTEAIRKELLQLPGFGPYAADNFLRSIGRFDGFAIDSMVRTRWKQAYPRRKCDNKSIGRRFAKFGEWRGLALWLFLTGHWYRREPWADEF